MLKLHKADSACRVCKHQFSHHCLYIKVEQGGMQQPFVQPLEMVPCDSYLHMSGGLSTIASVNGKCGCLDWQPMDNLEFLELKADQAKTKDENNWD